MTAGGVISLVIILLGGLFIVYKRKMLMDVFSLNMHTATVEFQTQLENVGAVVIRQMEEQMSHLEFLLAEAEDRSRQLEEKIQSAEVILKAYEEKIKEKVFSQREQASVAETESVTVITSAYEQARDQEPRESGDRRKLIITMAEQGYNVTEIAKATGVGKGEIMLLLQLHRK